LQVSIAENTENNMISLIFVQFIEKSKQIVFQTVQMILRPEALELTSRHQLCYTLENISTKILLKYLSNTVLAKARVPAFTGFWQFGKVNHGSSEKFYTHYVTFPHLARKIATHKCADGLHIQYVFIQSRFPLAFFTLAFFFQQGYNLFYALSRLGHSLMQGFHPLPLYKLL